MIIDYNFHTYFLKIRAYRKPTKVHESLRLPWFGEFRTEMGVGQMGIFKRNVMQFINYVLQFQSTQQLFIVAPNTIYICLDIYLETVGGCNYWNVI